MGGDGEHGAGRVAVDPDGGAAAAVVAATVAITALLLLVRGLSRLGRSARSSATSSTVRPSSNGQRADQQPSRPLDGSEQGTASPPRQTTHWWPRP
jgi:hypothetical protein